MIKSLLLYFTISRLLFIGFFLLGISFLSLREGYLGDQFDSSIPNYLSVWANFDGRHFLSIATEGYQRTNFAYFPLYPLLISLLGKIIPVSDIVLGILVSLVSYFLAMMMIFKIIRLDYKKEIAYLSLGLLSFFPLSFFYHSVYADSLFLMLTVSSFYFARKGNWWLSGLFCGLSTATRLSGIALIPALFVEWYLQNQDKKDLKSRLIRECMPSLILGSLGFLGYLAYLQIQFGDFSLFQKSFSAWGQNGLVFPLQVVWRYIKIFFSVNPSLLIFWIAILEFLTLILYSAISIYVFKKVRKSYGVFMMILLLLVTFTGTFAGTPRYGLHLFPLFLGLALIISKRRMFRYFTYALFLVLGFILTALFTRGYFVA